MLQCIAPHLDIDQDGFKVYLKQYEDWITHIRTKCTYHHKWHESWFRQQYNKLPNVPFIGEEPNPLAEPKREEPHKHDFDFGWGIGPIVDSYTPMYKHNGPPRPRQPGHEEMEIDGEWTPIKGIPGDKNNPPTKFKTHEYIHPLVQYRKTVLTKWDKWDWNTEHPLNGWTRKIRPANDGSQRYWWHRGGSDTDRLPEWCILPDTKEEINYERTWYTAAQSMNLEVSVRQHLPAFLEELDKETRFQPKRINEWEM